LFGKKRLRIVRRLGEKVEIQGLGQICGDFATKTLSPYRGGTCAKNFDIDGLFAADIIPRG
jgi:hypothetical protein